MALPNRVKRVQCVYKERSAGSEHGPEGATITMAVWEGGGVQRAGRQQRVQSEQEWP